MLERQRDRLHTLIWAVRARRTARRQLRTGGLAAVRLPPSPKTAAVWPWPRTLTLALRVLRASCLERSLVRQAWLADRGRPSDVIIGARAPREGFAAHAWLDFEGESEADGYVEVARYTAPGRA